MAHVELNGLFRLTDSHVDDVQRALIEFLEREGMAYKIRGTEIEARQGSTFISWLFLMWFAPWRVLPKRALLIGYAGNEPGVVSTILAHIEDRVFALTIPGEMVWRYRRNFALWMERLEAVLGTPGEYSDVSLDPKGRDEAIQSGPEMEVSAARRFHEMGRQYLFSNEWQRSIDAFDRCLESLAASEDSRDSEVTRARTLRNRGLAYDGLSEELVKESAGFSDMLLAIDAAKSAIADFEESVGLEPQRANTHSDMGKCLMSLAQFQLGARRFKEASESFERAFASLQEAIDIDPTLVLAYYNRALLAALVADSEQARMDFEKAVSLGADASELAAKLEAIRPQDR